MYIFTTFIPTAFQSFLWYVLDKYFAIFNALGAEEVTGFLFIYIKKSKNSKVLTLFERKRGMDFIQHDMNK